MDGAGSRSPSRARMRGTGSARCSTTSAGSTTRPASTPTRSTRSSARSSRGKRIGTRSRSPSAATRSARHSGHSAGRREAVPLLEQAVAWAESDGSPDGWYHEELALEYAALGRTIEAAEQARLALPLLEEADPGFGEDGERASRLRDVAGAEPS